MPSQSAYFISCLQCTTLHKILLMSVNNSSTDRQSGLQKKNIEIVQHQSVSIKSQLHGGPMNNLRRK